MFFCRKTCFIRSILILPPVGCKPSFPSRGVPWITFLEREPNEIATVGEQTTLKIPWPLKHNNVPSLRFEWPFSGAFG